MSNLLYCKPEKGHGTQLYLDDVDRSVYVDGQRHPLTEQEFCGILTTIRDGADRAKFGDGVLNQCSRRNCPFRRWC